MNCNVGFANLHSEIYAAHGINRSPHIKTYHGLSGPDLCKSHNGHKPDIS